ncbi:MAG TPA: hypothetical protein VEU08_20765 [Vicinamibacterales bacterium]|nr:hypothetical protein [Vicinamibacterales bacterium]
MRLQLLLKRESRNPAAIQAANETLKAAGITPTASGAATISGDVSPEAFRTLFPGVSETTSDALPVPTALAQHVESVTLAREHVRLD